MKKITAIVLCLAVIAAGTLLAAPSSQAAADGADIPVIQVVGMGEKIYRKDADGNEEILFPMQIPNGYIEEKTEVFLPVFAQAFFTQEWDEFCDVLYECLIPILSKPALDKNGKVSDGSYIKWSWSRETLWDNKTNGKYGATGYTFNYDWRVSPLETAELLHQYIEDVMYVTGAKEVALYGRCYGSNVVAAYMQKYNGEHVSEVIHYCSAMYGASTCSKLFTGEAYLHPDGIDRFIYDIKLNLEEYIADFIKAFVTLLNKTYGLDIVSWAVDNVLDDIYLDIFPRILIESFGTFPSFWSMVSLEDFDKAMDTVFYDADLTEYSGLTEKINNYHDNVQLTFEDTLKQQSENGIEFSNIVKYGYQLIPVTENGDDLSDSIVTVNASSFGATVTRLNETFSDEYISNAVKDQKARYISPDMQIDASTCLLPDATWFIKDLTHADFPVSVNGLVSAIVNGDGFNVNSSAEYPQYLVFDGDSGALQPMTSENSNTTERWEVTFFNALVEFWKNLITIIKQALN